MHWMYTAVLRPMTTYASFIWYKEAAKKTYSNMLSKIQRLACVLITGAMRSTPTSAMEAMLCLPPLHLFMKSEAKLMNFKCTVDDRDFITRLTDESLNKEQERDAWLNVKKADTTSAKYFLNLPFKDTISDRSEWSSNPIIAEDNDLN